MFIRGNFCYFRLDKEPDWSPKLCLDGSLVATTNDLPYFTFFCDRKGSDFVDDGEDLLVLVGKWADPGGTAMPGQPVTRPEQAPEPHPLAKISLISKGAHGPRIRY